MKHKGYYYGALLYSVLIPFHQQVATVALGLWVLFSILSFSKIALAKNSYLVLLPLFYLVYFFGFFTSETLSFRFLETKLSFLIFPLLFFLHPYDADQRNKMLKLFVLGLITSIMLCAIVALYQSIGFQDNAIYFQANVLEGKGFMESTLYGGNYFFGKHLSIFHQTVYYALYLCVGIAVLLFKPRLFSLKLRIALLGVFTLFIFLISNKASFIALALTLCVWLFTWKGNSTKKYGAFSILALVLVVFVSLNPRIKDSVTKVTEGQLSLNQNARYGFATRILSWNAAISLIKEKPFLGYGYADTQRVLNRRYEQKGYTYPLKEQYNAHNLWLQSWLENGIFAVAILIGIFYFLVRQELPYFKDQPLLLTLVLIVFVNSLFEGMFNRFSGISFFSFLVCFIFSVSKGGRNET